MAATAILDDRKSLSIAFLDISHQYATFILKKKSQNGRRRPFWMTENHVLSHFLPFQINTQLFFCFQIGAFLIKLWSTQAFSSCFHKMAAGGHFGFPDSLQNR